MIDEKKLFETETKILREKLKIKQVSDRLIGDSKEFEDIVKGEMPLPDGQTCGFVSELNTLQRDILNILDVPLYYYYDYYDYQYLYDSS